MLPGGRIVFTAAQPNAYPRSARISLKAQLSARRLAPNIEYVLWKLQENSYPFKICLHTNFTSWKRDPKARRRGALGKYFEVVDNVRPDQDFVCLVILTTLRSQLKLLPAKCLCPGREQKAAEGPGQVNGAISQPTSYRHSAEFPGSTHRLGSSPAASWS